MRPIRFLLAVLAAILTAGTGTAAARADQLPDIRIGWVVCPPELQPVLFVKDGVALHLGKTYTFAPMHFQGTAKMITELASDQIDIVPFTYPALGTAGLNAGISNLRIIAGRFEDGAAGYFSEHY